MNMKRNTVLCLLLIALVAAMILSGCGKTEVEAGEKEPAGTTAPGTTDPTGTTQPTDPADPTDPSAPADPADPTDPSEPEKKPNTSGLPGTPGNPNTDMTYEQYMALGSELQWEHFLTFEGAGGATAFNAWYNAAKSAWDAAQDKEITDGNITLD